MSTQQKEPKRSRKPKAETQKASPSPKAHHERADNDFSNKDDTEGENELIRMLRLDDKLPWLDIAEQMNQDRRDRGKAAYFTKRSVYSRFARYVPRTLTEDGQIALKVDPDNESMEGVTVRKKRKRAGNLLDPNHSTASDRKRNKVAMTPAEMESAQMGDLLKTAVSQVDAKYWSHVADELERMTTKLYDPKDLQNCYEAL